MNYIKEMNSFYDWLETNTLSDTAINLWHALMHINNKTGWLPEFAVAISILESKTGLKKDAIIRARDKLQQLGRIQFTSRNGQQSALYRINSFDCVVLNDTNYDTNRYTNRTQTATQTTTLTASINKLNETKLNRDISSSSLSTRAAEVVDIVEYVEKSLGQKNEAITSDILSIIEDGFHDAIFVKKIVDTTCVQAATPTWAYVKFILDECLCKKIQTVMQFDGAEATRWLRRHDPQNHSFNSS